MARQCIEIDRCDIINGTPSRLLGITASDDSELTWAVEQAKRKGWQNHHLYEGYQAATGWHTCWLDKPRTEPASAPESAQAPPTP